MSIVQKLKIKYHFILEFLIYQIYKGSDFFPLNPETYLSIPSTLTKLKNTPRLPDDWEVLIQQEHAAKKKTTIGPGTR